jgi:hypothetical protein
MSAPQVQQEPSESRAAKLERRGVPFFVVKASEPYARQVVALIKAHEGDAWTAEDEAWAESVLPPAQPSDHIVDANKKVPSDQEARELLREARPYLERTNWGQPGTDLPERIDAYLAKEG